MNKTRILAYFIHNYDNDYDYDNHGNDVPNDDFHFLVSPYFFAFNWASCQVKLLASCL